MNLKKWGSLLTAIAMVSSMAASLPVSAAEAAKVTFKGDLSSHVSYEYNVTDNVITLDADVDNSEVPNCNYGDDKGIISQIAYDHTGETGFAAVTGAVKVVINSANIDSVEAGAFMGLDPSATVEIHCQSNLAADKDSLDFIIEEGVGTVTTYHWKKQTNNIINYSITANETITKATWDAFGTTSKSYFTDNSSAEADTYKAGAGAASTGIEKAEYEAIQNATDKLKFTGIDNWVDATGDGAKQDTTSSTPPAGTAGSVQWVADTSVTGNASDTAPSVGATLADANVSVTHEMEANTTLHNHKCKYGDKIENGFAAHNFTKEGGATIDTTAHTHTCACGKKDTDYVTNQVQYEGIHTFNAATHVCSVCGSDNKYVHNQSANLTITADDKTTHSKKCATATCTYKTNKEAHNIVVNATDANITVNSETIVPQTHYCDVCGYHGDDIQKHEYLFVMKPIKATNASPYAIALTTPGTGETALVCKCGKVKETHTAHTFKGENGFHYCLCGETMASDGSDVHVYNKRIDTVTGKEVYDSLNGVYCDCGYVKTAHSGVHGDADQIYVDTVNHKHICSCGVDLSDTKHDYTVIKNGKHLCVCGKENPVLGNGHNYDTIVEAVTSVSGGNNVVVGTTKTTVVSGGLICVESSAVSVSGVVTTRVEVCNAVNPAHQSHDWQDDGNHGHFCACGETSTTHDYVSGVCTICGDLENHEHVLDDNCDCTVAGCGQTDIHSFVKVAEGKHICERCGESSLICVYDDFDTVNHEHKCSICGKVKTGADNVVHNYGAEGAAKCVCQDCGNVEHHNTSLNAGTHKCTDCNKNIDHKYDPATDKCTLNSCTAVKPGHVHAFDSNSSGDEKCRCGATIEHEFALVANNAAQHKCTHDKRNAAGVVTATCSFTPAAHNYGTSGICACGAVNPATLSTVRTLNPNSLVNTHTTSYIVSLTKARNAVLAYDVTTDGTTAKTVETAVAAIKLVKSDADQAEFAKLLADFNEINADADNNKAGGYLEVSVLASCTAFGTVENAKLGGTVGSKVTAVAIANDGYKFDGWYSDSAGANKFADTANYEYTLGNGTSQIFAKFVPNDKVAIILPVGVCYKGSVTQSTLFSSATTARETKMFNLGETVCIKADTSSLNGATFLSFKDLYGYAHTYNYDSTGSNGAPDCYKFTVTGKDEFILNSYTVSAGHKYITFTNANGTKELAMGTTETVNGKESIADIEPSAPLALGRTFVGWKYKEATQAALDAAPFVRLKDITDSGTLVPYYEKQTGLKLTVKGGRFGLAAEAEQNKTGFTYDDIVTLTADKQNDAGKYFSGWFVGATMVSNKLTFKYAVKGSVTIEAKYEGDEELVPESVYTLAYTQTPIDGGRQVVLTANWAMSNEVTTIIDSGYVFAFTNVSSDDLNLANADGSAIRKKSTGLTDKTGVYAYSLNLKSATTKNAPVCAKFYVTYVDANGAQKTVYTDMVTVNP